MSLTDAFEKIEKASTKLEESNRTVLQTLSNFIKENETTGEKSETQNKIVNSITKIGTAAAMLATGDDIDIFSGILTILSGASLYVPGGGPIGAAVLSLASSFISAFCSSKGNAGCVVENSIMSALKKFNDSELKAKTVGTVNAYRVSVAFLDGITHIEKDEVSAVMSSVPILNGVEFLGILKYKIQDNIESNEQDDILRAIEYTRAYTELSTLRMGVLLKLYIIILKISKNISDGIKSIIKAEKREDKIFLKNVFKRDYSRAVFFACLHPSTIPTVLKYLKYLHIPLKISDLKDEHSFSFVIPSYNTVFGLTRPFISFIFSPIMSYLSRDEDSKSIEVLFELSEISEQDSVFYILSKKEPQLYVYMAHDTQCYAKEETPGLEGKWKITKFEDGYYMLSTMKWPDWFMYGIMSSSVDYKHKPLKNCPEYLYISLMGRKFVSSHFDLTRDSLKTNYGLNIKR